MILFCAESDVNTILDVIHKHKYGQKAAVIGKVSQSSHGRVVLKTSIGGERIIDLPTGELVPRIC